MGVDDQLRRLVDKPLALRRIGKPWFARARHAFTNPIVSALSSPWHGSASVAEFVENGRFSGTGRGMDPALINRAEAG